jgi:hypothetical protein
MKHYSSLIVVRDSIIKAYLLVLDIEKLFFK